MLMLLLSKSIPGRGGGGGGHLGYADCGMVFQVLLLDGIRSTSKWGARVARAKNSLVESTNAPPLLPAEVINLLGIHRVNERIRIIHFFDMEFLQSKNREVTTARNFGK